MKKLVLVLIILTFFISGYAQRTYVDDKSKIKNSITGFLKWYKKNGNYLEASSIIKGFKMDSIKTGDSLVRVDMNSVGSYLNNLKKSNYIIMS